MTTDFTSKPLVHTIAGADDVRVERDHTYSTEKGPLGFEIYRPPHATAPTPAVVLVTGFPEPAATQFFGKPLKDWASYVGWARMIAAAGVAAITYAHRDPGDVHALFAHLRERAGDLGLDASALGVWACSGNVPNALGVIARHRPAGAALLYGYLLDLDGATAVAAAARQMFFAAPAVSLDDLRDTPILVVRAGADTTPGLDATLQRFVAAARAGGLPVTLLDHPTAPHAFDLLDDSPTTHATIDRILAFLSGSVRSGTRAPAGS